MSRKLLIKFLSLTTALTLLLSPLAVPPVAHADALNSVVSGIGGAFAGAGAGAGIGGAVGGLIGGRSGTSLGAAIGAIAGGIAGGIAGATGNLNGLNGGLGFGQFSNYGIHVPQGTVLQANTPQLEPLIVQIINFFLGFVGVLAFLMLVYGGFRYLSSAGEAEAAKKGKQTISYAVIGVVIIALSYAAVNTLITGIGPQVSPNATGLNVVNNFPAPGASRVGLGFSFRL
jgi:hypothetical protein